MGISGDLEKKKEKEKYEIFLLPIKLLSITKIDDFRQYFKDVIKIDDYEDNNKYKLLSIFYNLIIKNRCNDILIKRINEYFGNIVYIDNQQFYKNIFEELDNEFDKYIKEINNDIKFSKKINNSKLSIIKDLFEGKKNL